MCEGAGDVHDLIDKPVSIAASRALDGRARLLVAAWALVANVAASTAVTPALLAIGSLALVARSRIPPGTMLRRLVAPWYFALVACGMQLFLSGQTPLFQLGPLVATQEGLARGILLASKVIGGTAVVLALSLTTPVSELLAAAAWLRVPPVLVEIATLIYRYLFLLAEEADRIREAQAARLGYRGWRRSLESYSQMAALVLINAYSRAERIYEAMLLRGYTGELPTKTRAMTGRQVATCAQCLMGITAVFLLGKVVR